MSIFHQLPVILAKDTSPPETTTRTPLNITIYGKKRRGNPAKKYDHWQMLQDRLGGMSWREVGAKHEVHGDCESEIGLRACKLATYSQASLRLTPAQVEALHEPGDRVIKLAGRP